jgi:diaminopimelate decarboxylase
MDEFRYEGDSLVCEGVPLSEIADRVGTPTYVYSETMLERAVRRFDDAFSSVPHLVCYGIKANSNLNLLERFARWGIGFDAVSGGELFRAIEAGATPDRVILSGVGKTPEEIEFALESGVLFISAESRAEVATIGEVASGKGMIARVVLRTNPNVDAKTHPYISTGLRNHKFGIALDDATAIIRDASGTPGVDIVGIGCHIGSQITEIAPFEAAAAGIVALALEMKKHAPLDFLDFGGGLGVSYNGEVPPSVEQYADTLIRVSKGTGLTLVLEPGRIIVGPAGILLCRVIRKKTQGEKTFVIVDAAMNDLIRPSLYRAFHQVRPVKPRAGKEMVDLVGPICESTDFLAEGREIETLEPGDLVAVMTAGAYGWVLSSNYNSRPRSAEVLVRGGEYSTIRRRETYEDLIRLERA